MHTGVVDSQRRIPVPGTYNFRDPGGYAAAGGSIRLGALYRADGLHSIGAAGKSELRRLGVSTVIDLRDDFETSSMPDDLAGLDVTVYNHSVFEGSGASHGRDRIDLASLYERIVTQHSHVVAAALREISATSGGALVHCTAGKDRTGVVVALALLAVGVDRDTVVGDYSITQANLSGEWLERMVEMVGRHGIPDSPELRTLMGSSPPEAIDGMIGTVLAAHGSVEGYLSAAGLSTADLGALHTKLVV